MNDYSLDDVREQLRGAFGDSFIFELHRNERTRTVGASIDAAGFDRLVEMLSAKIITVDGRKGIDMMTPYGTIRLEPRT